MSLIGKRYDIEREYAHATPAERLEARQTWSTPVPHAFRQWLYKTANGITPKSALGHAVSYAIKNLDGLEVYLSDPWVPIDNNRVEQQIRSFAIGRKNWVFHHQVYGAEASARL